MLNPAESSPLVKDGFALTLGRMQREFLELPGLRLSSTQAQRLWHLDPLVCDALLGALVDVGFLMRTRDGTYTRVTTASQPNASSLARR